MSLREAVVSIDGAGLVEVPIPALAAARLLAVPRRVHSDHREAGSLSAHSGVPQLLQRLLLGQVVVVHERPVVDSARGIDGRAGLDYWNGLCSVHGGYCHGAVVGDGNRD